jgi:peptidoglycan/LPS O-acetylase OafA/YrhL
MQAWARAAILSATTIWLLALTFVVGLIYGLYSSDLGRGGFSVQAFLVFATGISFLTFLGAALGFHVGAGSGRMPGKVLCLIVGASTVAFSSAALSIIPYQPHNIEFVTGVTFCTASLVLAFIASKLVNLRKGLLPNKSLERTREG